MSLVAAGGYGFPHEGTQDGLLIFDSSRLLAESLRPVRQVGGVGREIHGLPLHLCTQTASRYGLGPGGAFLTPATTSVAPPRSKTAEFTAARPAR